MARENTLSLFVDFNAKQALTGLRQLQTEVNKLEKSFAAFSPRSQNNNPYSGIIEGAQSAIDALNEVQQKFRAVTAASTSQIAEDINEWRSEALQFNSVIQQSQKLLRDLGKQSDQLAGTFKKLEKPINIKFNQPKIPKIDPVDLKIKVEGTQPQTDTYTQRKADFDRRVKTEDQELRQRSEQRRQTERDRTFSQRYRRDAQANRILRDLQGESGGVFQSDSPKKRGKSSSGFDEIIKSRRINQQYVTPEYNQERQNRIREGIANLKDQQEYFGTFMRRGEERRQLDEEQKERLRQQTQERLDKIKREREQRRKEVQARIQELEQQKRERERERKRIEQLEREEARKESRRQYETRKRVESVKGVRPGGFGSTGYNVPFRRGSTTFDPSKVTFGFGGSNLGRGDAANQIRPFRAIGNVGLDVIERRSPAALQDTLQGAQELMGAFGATGIAAGGLALAISGGLVAAITGAIAVVEQFGKQFNYAVKDQLAGLGLSSETQRVFGVSQREGDSFYEQLQQRTEIAGRDTSVSAESITQLNSIGLPAFQRAYKEAGRDLDQVSNDIVKQNTRFAILAQATPGVTPFQVQNAYSSAVSGNLGNALNRQEFFRNSGLGDVVKQVAQEQGISDIQNASQVQQIDLLNQALDRRVPQSLIDRLQKDSLEAQLSATYDYFFAPRTGVFGILRDLDSETEGRQSVFDEVSRSISLIIGRDGIIAEFIGIFNAAVPSGDVMKDIREGIKAVNNLLEWFAGQFREIKQLVESVTNNPIVKAFDDTLARPGENILSVGREGIKSEYFSRQGERAGSFFGNIASGVGDFFGGLFGRRSYDGWIPTRYAADGFMPLHEAIRSELANKPKSSNLVVANDSEFILRPEQFAALMNVNAKPAYGGSTSRMVNIGQGAIQINNPTANSAQIAEEVIGRLNTLVEFEIESTL